MEKCNLCYGLAKKSGRTIRLTSLSEYPLCTLCESRAREGFIHYVPSNGTEGNIFEERCESCRHHTETPDGMGTCRLKILDQLWDSAWSERDSMKCWY
jgi:hypothetical protein